MTKSVLVAMSGGVDSLIAAWKLKRAGYHVNGVYFHFWKWNTSENEYGRDSDRLNNLAEKIGVDLVEVDAQEIFKAKVISPMVEMIEKGLTPNPCIFCNPEMKFSLLINYADQMGITHIATGHYVISREKKDNLIGLFKAEDKAKDQSYFLCKLDQEILKRVIFPLGYTNKKENIVLATKLGLQIEKIYESQDLCFLSNHSYSEFINMAFPQMITPGVIKNIDGKIIGKHKGLPNYTIGQRKGIEIPAAEPYYVVAKDTLSNTLIVGSAADLKFREMVVSNVNWISGAQVLCKDCYVKIRYKSPDHPCSVKKMDERNYRVISSQDLRDLTPGQYAVFYDGDELLGGGMISSVLWNHV